MAEEQMKETEVTRRNSLELEKANQDEKAEADELQLPVQKLLTSSTSRIRKRAANGPAARIEPWQESAVSRALRRHQNQGHTRVLPCSGNRI